MFQSLPLKLGKESCLANSVLPDDILNLCLDFCGGIDELPLVCDDESVVVPEIVFRDCWISDAARSFDVFRSQFEHLCGRRYCVVRCKSGNSIVDVTGWLSVQFLGGVLKCDLLTKNAPFQLRRDPTMSYEIVASEQGYCFGHVLNDPEIMLNHCVQLAIPHFRDVKTLICENVWDKVVSSEVPKWVMQMVNSLAWRVPLFEKNLGSISPILKDHSVGKFRRKRKFDRLKKKKLRRRGPDVKKGQTAKKRGQKARRRSIKEYCDRNKERKRKRVHKRRELCRVLNL